MAAALHLQALFRYLVVDDLLIHRKGIQQVVKLALDDLKYPCVCDSVTNGADAVQMCAQKTYQLVILDYYMPGMNGAETARKILALQPNVYIVGCTTMEDRAIIQECLDAGMKQVLPKDWIQVRELVKRQAPLISSSEHA